MGFCVDVVIHPFLIFVTVFSYSASVINPKLLDWNSFECDVKLPFGCAWGDLKFVKQKLHVALSG